MCRVCNAALSVVGLWRDQSFLIATPTHRNTSFIAISTLTSEMNFYTKLISKIDPLTGLPVFKSCQIQLACQQCLDNEKVRLTMYYHSFCTRDTHRSTDTCGQGFECMHMQHLIPRWQDGDKHRRLKTIMSDRPDLIVSEMGGVAFSSVNQCFRYCDLKRMFESSIPMRIEWNTLFFVCVDPCAGGEHSDFAVVSFVYLFGSYQVCVCAVPSMSSGEYDQAFDLEKCLMQATRGAILVRKNILEKVGVHDTGEDGNCDVRVQGLQSHVLAQEGIVSLAVEIVTPPGYQEHVFLEQSISYSAGLP